MVTIASGNAELGLAVFLDLDQTLVLTQAIESLRKKRDWPSVYRAFHKTHLPPGTKVFLRQLGTLAKVGVVTNSPRSYAVREAQGLRSGGFGLLLAQKLVDELIYSKQGNDVLLVKYLNPAGLEVA